jgi:hypothetical protein
MKIWMLLLAILSLSATTFASGENTFEVTPFLFDPSDTRLVQSAWLSGIGCPTNATVVPYGGPPTTFSDAACQTGDPRDKRNEGLLLAKTGPLTNNAAAGAELKGVRGTALLELGYDIRKGGAPGSAIGSHCGAGAPRFNIVSGGALYFLGCNLAGTRVAGSPGWTRLKWGSVTGGRPLQAYTTAGVLTNITGVTVDRISIIFDEGDDIGTDFFGAVVLDNIDVNGVLVGRGSND